MGLGAGRGGRPVWQANREAGEPRVSSVQDYLAFGLRIRSEIELPELAPALDDAAKLPLVTVTRGHIPTEIPNTTALGAHSLIGDQDYVLNITSVGRFHAKSGEQIIIDALPDASERNIRIFLLGSMMGALCHQRGLLPLHASAIEYEGGAIAFVGDSGAGKSTLSAYLHDKGYPLLCDDVCVVSRDANAGAPMAWPGVRRIKLWQDALSALRGEGTNLERVFDGMDKYHVPVTSVAEHKPLPLKRIYLLENATEEKAHSITRLTGVSALNAVLTQTYRRFIGDLMGNREQHFKMGAELLRSVRIYTLRRHRGFDVFERETARLMEHIRDQTV